MTDTQRPKRVQQAVDTLLAGMLAVVKSQVGFPQYVAQALSDEPPDFRAEVETALNAHFNELERNAL